MEQSEFIKKMIGVKWVNRASTWSAVDCFGLVDMYYKHVIDVELPCVSGYLDGKPMAECWTGAIDKWVECTSPVDKGLMFTCYEGSRPTHVGVVISPTKVLHCRGTSENQGKVEIHSIRAMKSIYGRITYHKLRN